MRPKPLSRHGMTVLPPTRRAGRFRNADDNPVEILSPLGRQGERAHLRARTVRTKDTASDSD